MKVWSVPPSSTSDAHGDRVVALHQRVEQLEDRDRRARRVARGEVLAVEQLGDRRRAREAEQLRHPHVEPFAVEAQLVALGILVEDLLRLALVGARVGLDLLVAQHGPRVRATARVADARRVVADDQHDAVAEVLELAQLLQDDRVPEVDVRRRRVQAELHAQLAALARRPCAGARRARPAGSDWAALRVRKAACEAGSEAAAAIPANASLSPGAAASRRTRAHSPAARRRTAPPPAIASRDERRRPPRHPHRRRAPGAALAARRAETPPPDAPEAQEAAAAAAARSRSSLLAGISTVFGMMMAVARDLPDLESAKEFQTARNSTLVDRLGQPLGILTSDRNRVLVQYDDISKFMRDAIISVEDERFYENQGVDVRGIGRAFYQDVVSGGPRQGGSTITQQFVKNALEAQSQRTLFQKLREAALAYHLTRKWSKKKILREYLNSIYFGNGAYGIESAARVYFGSDPNHADCGTRLRPVRLGADRRRGRAAGRRRRQPHGVRPRRAPRGRARARRNLVLGEDARAGQDHAAGVRRRHRGGAAREGRPADGRQRRLRTSRPGSASSSSSASARGAPSRAGCASRRRSTSTCRAPRSTRSAQTLGGVGPAAAMVVIDNATGEVRALVGGTDYRNRPVQPRDAGPAPAGLDGQAVHPRRRRCKRGIGLGSVWESRKRVFDVPQRRQREVRRQQLRGLLRRRARRSGRR